MAFSQTWQVETETDQRTAETEAIVAEMTAAMEGEMTEETIEEMTDETIGGKIDAETAAIGMTETGGSFS